MLESAIVAYCHYLSFMLAIAALAVERLSLQADLSLQAARRIVVADVVYGLSAIGVLITGILRVLYFGKGADYYLDNPLFWTKIGLFLLVGALSLYPTVTFILWIKDLQQVQVPSLSRGKFQVLSSLVSLEIVGMLLIPLFASLMARGIGLA
ncbi:DUF2214 family protein [Geitlerinema sp. P-1104]|uniref:DUF2214 family protein n=1 Tax=Geitlerinema sp. P-1104 TaxID=2546230 RepID=UPI0014768440|nr:DUF2214 family protein [Geitlerinema sp. P-1104]NMG57257.1 DUF2214 family protein [Geitlerinema sp. P-1104]